MADDGQVKINHGAFDTAIKELNSNSETLSNAVEDLRAAIDEQDWIGTSGEAFREVFNSIHQTLKGQASNLRTIGTNLHATDESFEELDCALQKEIERDE